MRTHLDDSELLEFSDRELGFWKYVRERAHLACCLQCRARLAELVLQTHALAKCLAAPVVTRSHIQAAKNRFFVNLADRDIPFPSSHRDKRVLWRFFQFGPGAALAAGLMVCASAFALWRAVQPPVQTTPPLIARAIPTAVLPKPEPTLLPAPPPAAIVLAPILEEPIAVPPPNIPTAPVANEDLEVRLIYALHQAGGCLGEQIELTRDGSGKFLIHGIVESGDRRRQLIDRLTEAAPPDSIATQIQTVDQIDQPAPGPEQLLAFDIAAQTQPATPGNDELLRFFKNQNRHETSAESQQRISEVSNAVVNRANAALADAWALKRLQQKFPAPKAKGLSHESGAMLSAMVQDHLNSLQTGIAVIAGLIESDEAGPPARLPDPDTSADPTETLFHATSEVHSELLNLFASAAPNKAASLDTLPGLRQKLRDVLALVHAR